MSVCVQSCPPPQENTAMSPLNALPSHCHLPTRTRVKVARFWPSQKSWRWHITCIYYKLHLIHIRSSWLLDITFEMIVTIPVVELISHWMSLLVWIHKPKQHLFGIRKFLKTGWIWACYIAIIFSDAESICSNLTFPSSTRYKNCLI